MYSPYYKDFNVWILPISVGMVDWILDLDMANFVKPLSNPSSVGIVGTPITSLHEKMQKKKTNISDDLIYQFGRGVCIYIPVTLPVL